jgi:peptide/nickel transport system permease protein
MLVYTLKRTLLALGVALTVSALAYSLLHLSKDPAVAMAGETASSEQIEVVRKQYGFDRPLAVQYLDWLGRALQGDLGNSHYLHIPVTKIIGERIGTTMVLGLSGMAFGLLLAIPLGVLAATRPNSRLDRFCLTLAVSAQALPSFWFSLGLIILLSVMLRLLPASGSDSWQHFVMPVIVLGTRVMPAIMRLTRTGMLDVLSSDFIRTARAKGVRPRKVLFKHALRNAIIPVVSVAAVQLGFLLSGSIIIETIFAIHGVGALAYESIVRMDLPVMQAVVLLFSFLFILATFLADLLNAWLDPRIRVA